MKNYFLFIATIFLVLACNQNELATEAPQPPVADTNKSINDSAKEIMKVSGLSAEEMKDDSVFADGSVPVPWGNAGITDVKGLKLFIKQLQQWVVENDKEKLAGAVKYPLHKIYKSPSDIVTHYDKVFTREVKMSLATINFSQLFRNYQGVMTQGGKIWIAQENDQFKIIAINP